MLVSESERGVGSLKSGAASPSAGRHAALHLSFFPLSLDGVHFYLKQQCVTLS